MADANAVVILNTIAGFGGTIMWQYNGITFQLSDAVLTENEQGYEVHLEASDANGPLPLNNPYRFYNPFCNVVTDVNKDGTVVVEYNVLQALREQVYDTVIMVARAHGWTPA